LAQNHGAQVMEHTEVTGITIKADSVDAQTTKGAFSAARLIITAGAWAKGLLASLDLDLPLYGMRAQEVYFEPTMNPDDYLPEKMPVFIYHSGFDNGQGIYGIPRIGGSWVKVALHGGDRFDHPSQVDYIGDARQVETLHTFTRRYLPALGDGRLASTRVCLYTMTPDEDFVIDQHPAHPNVVIGSPCSGHGFKFSTLIGKILGELAFTGRSDQDLSKFSIQRFL
jgi:sarcosine oxidase